MLGLESKPSTRTPPAKRWRNYYHVYRVLNLGRLGWVSPGIQAGPDAFPTKEIAEQHAKTFVAAINPPGRWYMDLAGIYPEGEAPN